MITNRPEHSLIGASSMHRWANCPGSVRLSQGMPNNQSEYALEGSRAHELAAYYLLHDTLPQDLDLQANAEMIEAIKVYTDAVFEDRRAFNGSFRGNLFLVEHGFELKAIDHNAYGTADCVLYNAQSKTLIVYDFKYGAGISVDVEHNEQLMYYALGALLSIPKLPVLKVILKIVQPRCNHPDGAVRSWSFDSHIILDFYTDLEAAVRRTQDPNAPLATGDWCRFCPAAPKCPLLNQTALEFAKDVFVAESHDDKELSAILDKIDVIEGYISQVREYAYREAVNGRVPPGYKLTNKRAVRRWREDIPIVDLLRSRLHVETLDLYETPKLKSPAQIEKLLNKKELEALVDLVKAESSGYKLVKESEPGEAVLLDAKNIFGEIE